MASPRELRRRIKSISGTAQITKAMQMVAASKMRKAQEAATAVGARSRGGSIACSGARRRGRSTSSTRCSRSGRFGAAPSILVAGDKGLCGALNTNVFRLASQYPGRIDGLHHRRAEGGAVCQPQRAQLAAEFAYGDSPTYAEARAIAAFARDLFLSGEVDQVLIVTTRFVNTLTQEPVAMEYLPVGEIKGMQRRRRRTRRDAAGGHDARPSSSRARSTSSATCWAST